MSRDFDEYFSGRVGVLAQSSMRLFQSVGALCRESSSNQLISTFWGFRNFGDLLTPYFLEKIGRSPLNFPVRSSAKLLMVGSILDSLSPKFKGTVFGSGALDTKKVPKLNNANIIGVRGELTRVAVGSDSKVILGDPGLMMSHYFRPDMPKKYEYGLVVHYEEVAKPVIQKLVASHPGMLVINVLRSPECVVKDILSCNVILSSSLHGLVMADSYGIPSAWVGFSDRSEEKYHDYYSAFNESRECLYVKESNLERVTNNIKLPSKNVSTIKSALVTSFEANFKC